MRREVKERRQSGIADVELFDTICELCPPGEVLTVRTLVSFGADTQQANDMLAYLTRKMVVYIGSIGSHKDKHIIRSQGPLGSADNYDADALAQIRRDLEP